MTNIKYSKRFKLRNGERVDFCPECDYHITDTVNNSDSVYCPKCGQQIQLFKPALCPVSYTHLRAHETSHDLVCRLLLEKKNVPRFSQLSSTGKK